MTSRLPTRAELELEAAILLTNQAIVREVDASGIDPSTLPADVQQGIDAARRATQGG